MTETSVKQKMGFTKKMRCQARIIFDGLIKNKNEIDKNKKSKSTGDLCDNGLFKKKKKKKKEDVKHFKQNKTKLALTTDAVPSHSPGSSKSESPVESPTSDPFLLEQNDFDEKCLRTQIPVIQLEKLKMCNEDDEGYGSKEKESDNESVNSKNTPKEERRRSEFNYRSRGNSTGSNKNFSYSTAHNTYNISNVTDIHIGPNYQQQIIINGIDNNRANKSKVKESEEIRALRMNSSPLTTELLDFVSFHIGHNWKTLGRKFGYSDGRIDQFESDFNAHKERVYQLLRDWTQAETDNATCATLSNALWAINERQAVEKLAKFISNKKVDDYEL